MRLSGQTQIFLRNIFAMQKNKNKQILNNKATILCSQKLHKRGETFILRFLSFKYLLKNFEFVLIASFTILLTWTPHNTPMEKFFSLIFYLHALTFIRENLFLFWKSSTKIFFIYDHL